MENGGNCVWLEWIIFCKRDKLFGLSRILVELFARQLHTSKYSVYLFDEISPAAVKDFAVRYIGEREFIWKIRCRFEILLMKRIPQLLVKILLASQATCFIRFLQFVSAISDSFQMWPICTTTFRDYETVEKVLDENPTSVRSYYTLSYNEKPFDKTILTFKPSECPTGEILRVKCKNLECGIRTQAPSQARYTHWTSFS